MKQKLNLSGHQLTKRSFIGTQNKVEFVLDGTVNQQFGAKYAPEEDSVQAHLEFLLKYDDLNLDFLDAVFRHVNEQELIGFISKSPGGKYNRKLGFLFEWLTGKELPLDFEPSGNYVDSRLCRI